MAYLRISTHPGIFTTPPSPDEAMGNINALLEVPHSKVLSEGPRFWDVYRDVTESIVVRGDLVPDAHVAALLLEHGIKKIVTNDMDFLKFPFLRVSNPCE
jgi:predicted nucleic acid-binding protein